MAHVLKGDPRPYHVAMSFEVRGSGDGEVETRVDGGPWKQLTAEEWAAFNELVRMLSRDPRAERLESGIGAPADEFGTW